MPRVGQDLTIFYSAVIMKSIQGEVVDMKTWKKVLIGVAIALGVILLAVIIYLCYVIFSYSRIPDMQKLDIDKGDTQPAVKTGQTYTIATQNLGFGAYTADFTFFMDGGKESRAESRESVIDCINRGAETVKGLDPDFILFQEVDLDSTRSHHTNQYKMLREHFAGYASSYAVNYDSAYLMYPIFSPHGKSYSSLATFSRFDITSSVRRSLPISESLSKFLDLDRCYSVSRIPTENGKELVIFNVHTSAYGSDDSVRYAQMSMLFGNMNEEYKKGNYVICGGDFNHDFTGDSSQKLNGADADFGWAQPLPTDMLPEGFSTCTNYAGETLYPTCRNCDVPYKKGNFTIIVDGFIVSDNIKCAEVVNIDTGFTYSDHAPVKMMFELVQ